MANRSETVRVTTPQQDLAPAKNILDGVSNVFSLAPKDLVRTSSDKYFGEIEIKPEELATSSLSEPIKEFFAAICAIADPEGKMAWAHPQPTVRLLNTGRSGSIWLGMISNSEGVFGIKVTGTTLDVFYGNRVEVAIMPDQRPTDLADEHMTKLNGFGIGEAYQNLVKYVESVGAAQVAEQLFVFAKSITPISSSSRSVKRIFRDIISPPWLIKNKSLIKNSLRRSGMGRGRC